MLFYTHVVKLCSFVLYTRLVRNQVVQYTKLLALIVQVFKKVPLFGNVRRFLSKSSQIFALFLLNLHNVYGQMKISFFIYND